MSAFITNFLPFFVLIIAMWFLILRPQRKREKEVNAMRNGLKVGDEIITIGGICGKIVKVKDESIVIQVGAERVKFEMMKWSVSKVVGSEVSKTSAKKARPTDEEAEEQVKKALPKKLKKEEVSETPAAEEAEEKTEA